MNLDSKKIVSSLSTQNPDSIIYVNKENIIININQKFTEVLGFTASEVLNKSFEEIIISTDKKEYTDKFKSSLHNNPQKVPIRLSHKKGYSVDVIIKMVPILGEHQDIEAVILVIEDITLLKKSFDFIVHDERMYRMMAENSNDLISLRTIDGQYLYISPVARKILGYEQDEIIGRNRRDFVYEEDFAASEKQMRRTLNNEKEICTFTYRVIKKEGSIAWLESTNRFVKDSSTGKIFGILTNSRDITDRINAENELKRREEIYRLLVEESPYAVIIGKKDRIFYINDTGVNLLGGNKKEDFYNKSPLEFVHPTYHDSVLKRIQDIESDKIADLIEEKWVRVDGQIIDVAVKGIPTIYNNEPARHLVVIDISERAQALELMKKSEKLSLVGELAAGMAHEIRNPLTSLMGFLQLIQNTQDYNNEYIDVMWQEFNKIELIVSEFLVLAKPHIATYKSVNLIPMLEQVLILINTQASLHNIQINKNYSVDELYIYCDENQMKQVFLNIFKNAIEAMPNGGFLTISISTENDEAVIKIIDTGIGIDDNHLNRIGEPFFTTKETGTGLGMMVTFKIIENHKGKLHISSKVNSGSTFEIRIPFEH